MSSFNMKQFFAIALASLVIFNYMARIACEDVAEEQTKTPAEASSFKVDEVIQKLSSGFLPVLVMRQNSDSTPDYFLGWTTWPGMSQFSGLFRPMTSTFGQYTQQASNAISRIPVFGNMATQANQMASQLSGSLNPMASLGGGSAGSMPLLTMLGFSQG